MPSLTDFWSDETAVYETRVSGLTTTTQTLQDELGKLSKDLASAQKSFATLADAISQLRHELAAATIPANANALVAQIRDKVIEQRTHNGAILELKLRNAENSAKLEVAQTALVRARSDLARANERLAAATAASTRRSAAIAALSTAPLSTMRSDANAAKSGSEQIAAKTKVDELPSDLTSLAEHTFGIPRAILQGVATLVSEAYQELSTHQTNEEGVTGSVDVVARAFRDSESALYRFSDRGKDQFDRAMGLLTRVSNEPLVSPAEVTELAVTTDRTAAATTANSIAGDVDQVVTTALAHAKAVFDAQRAAPDDDVATEPSVTTAEAALGDATADLIASQSGFSNRPILNAWTVIVTDTAWRKLRDYHDALAILDDLAATPTSLATDLAANETAYATALADDSEARRTREYIEDTITERQLYHEALSQLQSELSFSATRGDAI